MPNNLRSSLRLRKAWARCTLIHCFVASLIHCFLDWFTDSLFQFFIDFLFYWFIDCLIQRLTYWFIASFLRWFADSPVHQLTDSPNFGIVDSFSQLWMDSFMSYHWHLSSHFLIRWCTHNFNTSLFLHLKSFPVGHLLPIVASFSKRTPRRRPGTTGDIFFKY